MLLAAVVTSYCGLCASLEARLKRTWLCRQRYGQALVDTLLFPSDLLKVLMTHQQVTGVVPNLLRPRTFTHKLQQSKLLRRRRRHVLLTDKVLVREHVAQRAGARFLNQVYWVGRDLNEAREVSLPEKFVIKPNNHSGEIIVVRDRAQFDWDAAVATTQQWLASDHSVYYAEWQYRWIKPQLLIEALLENLGGNGPLLEYRFHVFHGRVHLIQVDYERLPVPLQGFYDREFRLLPLAKQGRRQYLGTHPKPENLDEMIALAENLGAGERFVRVDLYDVGRPVFGELTLHPTAGFDIWQPTAWDAKLGALML